MRFNKSTRSKLEDIFYKKMSELAFDDDRPVSTWSAYLAEIDCRRVHLDSDKVKAPRGFVIIKDPIWHGDYILIPKNTAVRVLALGLP